MMASGRVKLGTTWRSTIANRYGCPTPTARDRYPLLGFWVGHNATMIALVQRIH